MIHRTRYSERVENILLHCVLGCFMFIIGIVLFIVPRKLLYAIMYKKVKCSRCDRMVFQSRSRREMPPEFEGRPPVCSACCTPEEEQEVEEIVERHMKRKRAERYKR